MGEVRESKIVFIGKNLDRDELTTAFKACQSTPEMMEKKLKSLRFGVGTRVKCMTGNRKWSHGVVVKQLYREDFMPPGMVAPYQVKLDNGDLIYAPGDEDELIRKE